MINEKGELMQDSFWKEMAIKPNKFSLTDILFGNIITGCTTLINRSMTKELLRMPLNVMMYDHWIALIAYTFGSYFFIEEPTVLFRTHSQNVTGKEKYPVLKVFLDDFKNHSLYLSENIQQAIEFKTLYSDYLKREDLKKLEEFIDLREKSFVQKRFMRYYRSLLRKL
jgi:rhamnosyltransferase